jgi:hypothetical protein
VQETVSQKEYLNALQEAIKELKTLRIEKLDSNMNELKKAFDIAYVHKLFWLYNFDVATQDALKLKLFEKLAALSGNLAFLAIQILAANAIMNKNNFKRKKHFFDKKCGIAINHLRANKTIVKATKCEGGFKLNGTLSWASGYKIFNRLLIGFHYDNKEYEAMSHFKVQKGFMVQPCAKTFVGFGLNTVNIELKDYFVKDKNIVSSHPIGTYTKNKSISKTIHYSLYGLGCGVIKHISNQELKTYAITHLQEHKEFFLNSFNGKELDKQRIELFTFLQNIITTAMIQNGGKSVLCNQHLQQYYRELIMFNCNGLNQTIKELFLDRCLKQQ